MLGPVKRNALTGGILTVLLAVALMVPSFASAATAPLAQFGSAGAGTGQLSSPSGLAIDGSGNVYVADSVNNRISVFTAGGAFIRAFGWDVAEPDGATAFEVCPTQGACRMGDPGGGAGQLSGPRGVALDASGNLYVADTGTHRISVFNPAVPSFIRAFGWDVADPDGTAAFEVCPTQGACRAGDNGGGPGQLHFPAGVVLDGAGNLYVADASNDRISVFNSSVPSFTRAFGQDVADPDGGTTFEVCPTQGACRPGDGLGAAGGLGDPRGVALDGSGNLYVGDEDNARISVFNPVVPSFTRAFGRDVADPDGGSGLEVCPTLGSCRTGDAGIGGGDLAFPWGVALDGPGNLYVADDNRRINVFNAGVPSFTQAYGWDVADPDGTAAFEICPAQGACRVGDLAGSNLGQVGPANFVTADCRGAVWVSDTTNNRVQRFGEPGTPLPPCPASTPSEPPATPGPAPVASGTAVTGLRAAALKKCKKKRSATARRNCKRRANRLPI